MDIQSDSLATTTFNSSDAHPKQRSQFLSSIASAPNAHAAPESFDATHVKSSFVKLRGTVSGNSPYSSKAVHAGFSTGGHRHVRVLLPEDCCNLSPCRCALVIREETPSSLPVGCSTDGLPKLTRQQCVVVTPGYRLILILSDTGSPTLPGVIFRLGVPHQAHMETPLPEVYPSSDPCLDISSPMDAQLLHEDDFGKD